MADRDYVVYSGSGEWSALYIDGKLSVVGDHYLIDEALRAELGVEEFHSDDFLRGGNTREAVAPTLTELRSWSETQSEEAIQNEITDLRLRLKQLEESRR